MGFRDSGREGAPKVVETKLGFRGSGREGAPTIVEAKSGFRDTGREGASKVVGTKSGAEPCIFIYFPMGSDGLMLAWCVILVVFNILGRR